MSELFKKAELGMHWYSVFLLEDFYLTYFQEWASVGL